MAGKCGRGWVAGQPERRSRVPLCIVSNRTNSVEPSLESRSFITEAVSLGLMSHKVASHGRESELKSPARQGEKFLP